MIFLDFKTIDSTKSYASTRIIKSSTLQTILSIWSYYVLIKGPGHKGYSRHAACQHSSAIVPNQRSGRASSTHNTSI